MSTDCFLTGITLIRNGHILKYPFIESITSLAKQCDEVIVNVGKSEDETLQSVIKLQQLYPNISIYVSKWEMSNTGDGRELARQINLLLPKVKGKWVVYLQADEFLFYEPPSQMRDYLELLPESISQVELLRTYFWKDLNTRAAKYELFLGRIFKAGTHSVGGDGMFLIRHSGEVTRSGYWIYHYSRVGNSTEITKRVRNLDRLFHDKDIVDSMSPFNFDENIELLEYNGEHPEGIVEFYRSKD